MSNLLLPKATRRAYRGEADLPAIVNLLNRCEAADQMDTVIVQSKEIVDVAENVTEASFRPIDGTVKSYPLKNSLP